MQGTGCKLQGALLCAPCLFHNGPRTTDPPSAAQQTLLLLSSAWCLLVLRLSKEFLVPFRPSTSFFMLPVASCPMPVVFRLPTTYWAVLSIYTSFGIIIAVYLFAGFYKRASRYCAPLPDLPRVSNEYLAQEKKKRSPSFRGRDSD